MTPLYLKFPRVRDTPLQNGNSIILSCKVYTVISPSSNLPQKGPNPQGPNDLFHRLNLLSHILHVLPPSYNIAAALVHTQGTQVPTCKIYNTTYSHTSYTGEEPKLNAIPVPSGRLSTHTQNKELLPLIHSSMHF